MDSTRPEPLRFPKEMYLVMCGCRYRWIPRDVLTLFDTSYDITLHHDMHYDVRMMPLKIPIASMMHTENFVKIGSEIKNFI